MNQIWTQLWLHVLGDFATQSHWMATEKTKRLTVAMLHAIVYTLPFLLVFHPSPAAGVTMYATYALIDRFRLARYVVFLKNVLLSPWWASNDARESWAGSIIMDSNGRITDVIKGCRDTGYRDDVPRFLSVWLLIIVDSFLHITINALALRYL